MIGRRVGVDQSEADTAAVGVAAPILTFDFGRVWCARRPVGPVRPTGLLAL